MNLKVASSGIMKQAQWYNETCSSNDGSSGNFHIAISMPLQ